MTPPTNDTPDNTMPKSKIQRDQATPAGMPYPDSKAPVAHGANAIRAFAEAIDAKTTGARRITVFQNGFSSAPASPVQVRRVWGLVILEGELQRAAAPETELTALQLPEGFFPTTIVRLPLHTALGANLTIDTTGKVLINATRPAPPGPGSGYALAGISFIARPAPLAADTPKDI